ncbi:fumarate hydratase [uncultured Victivallis sp.]|uniref:fumarate hydratase n=1 Tax=uncultured Victivallis sp. TaxID=354118 RepID=UPI0025E5BFA7|nr:fumarate hydratase [uncultured Victivallis sp.]
MSDYRIVSFEAVAEAVADLCGKAACDLPPDVLDRLRQMEARETSELGRDFFAQYLENARIAREERMPLCQDTGFAVCFVELGDRVRFDRGTVYEAISEGVARGYREHFLRKSIVNDPLFDRKNTQDNTPPVIHLELVPGEKLHITLAPKGGGSENMSAIRMLKPSDGRQGVVDFAVETLRKAGGNPCPPTVVGMGIGGTFEKAAFLAKKALLRKIGEPNPDPRYAELEAEILEKINATGVGPQGLGGSVTSLAVHIEFFPCHIASLPVAINVNCHAARHAEVEL